MSELPFSSTELDRLRELTNIGAGHAAGALAGLLGRSFRMRVPAVRLLRAQSTDAPFIAMSGDAEQGGLSGVFFQIEGGLSGIVAWLLPEASRDALVAELVGPDAASVDEEAASALREVGNILVSHVASAMAETLGETVLPSIPVLAMEDAFAALASLLALRGHGAPTLRIETEIFDDAGSCRGLLVFVPDVPGVGASPPA